jgi:hypothetical protein
MERSRPGMGGGAPGQLEGGYDDNAAPEMPEEQAGGDQEEAPTKSEGKTTHIPIDLLGGKDFKEGEEVMFKIVKLDPENKTVEIEYAPGKGGEEEKDGADPREAAGGDEEGMDQSSGGKMMGDGSEY